MRRSPRSLPPGARFACLLTNAVSSAERRPARWPASPSVDRSGGRPKNAVRGAGVFPSFCSMTHCSNRMRLGRPSLRPRHRRTQSAHVVVVHRSRNGRAPAEMPSLLPTRVFPQFRSFEPIRGRSRESSACRYCGTCAGSWSTPHGCGASLLDVQCEIFF